MEPHTLIDSLKKIRPELGELRQSKYTYDLSGTGYDHENLYLEYEGERYVLGLSMSSQGEHHELRVKNFGREGEILEKCDSISRSDKKILEKIIDQVLLIELKKVFPEIHFLRDC